MTRTAYPLVYPTPPPLRVAEQSLQTLPAALQSGMQDMSMPQQVYRLYEYLTRLGEYIREIAEVANGSRSGKINSVGDVTLTASSATTTLSDSRIGPNSFIGFMPTTANAASALQDGAFYISARSKGSATITHTNDANDDKSFVYVVLG